MRFRQRLFWLLAAVSLLWLCGGVFLVTSSAGEVAATPQAASGSLDADTATAAYQAGVAIGGGIGLTVFACTGVPAFLVFALLAWRNGVGLRSERQHREQVEAMQAVAGGRAQRA